MNRPPRFFAGPPLRGLASRFQWDLSEGCPLDYTSREYIVSKKWLTFSLPLRWNGSYPCTVIHAPRWALSLCLFYAFFSIFFPSVSHRFTTLVFPATSAHWGLPSRKKLGGNYKVSIYTINRRSLGNWWPWKVLLGDNLRSCICVLVTVSYTLVLLL